MTAVILKHRTKEGDGDLYLAELDERAHVTACFGPLRSVLPEHCREGLPADNQWADDIMQGRAPGEAFIVMGELNLDDQDSGEASQCPESDKTGHP